LTTQTSQEVGDNIAARCAKCKDVTDHTILSFKKEDKVGDVRCAKCSYEHGYRQPRMKKGSAGSIASAAARKKVKADAEFEEMMKGTDPASAISYEMSASFLVGTLMDHKVFGLGKVIELMTPDKAVVHFREGHKILVCVIRTDSEE
jgi:hypothetical protein